MDQRRLRPSARLGEAEWVARRLAPFGSTVASVVPDRFPAYVRILHPGRSMDGSALRWSDVALKSGRMMHRLVQFHAINRSPVAVSEGAVEPPQPGNLADDLLSVMCAALAEQGRA